MLGACAMSSSVMGACGGAAVNAGMRAPPVAGPRAVHGSSDALSAWPVPAPSSGSVNKEVPAARVDPAAASELDLLARTERQREDRRAWAAAVQAAERAAAMAAMLRRGAPDPDDTLSASVDPAPERQRQLDVALRIVRMPDASGLRFELRL